MPDGSVFQASSVDSVPGASVHLTINSDLQKVSQKALKQAVKEANEYAAEMEDKEKGADCKGAAVVVLSVKDFSVLAAASYPYYDLSKYYDDYSKLASDKSQPLFDRAFMGALAPGSTFKPLVASAALQEGAITTKTHIDCQGVYTKNGLYLRCMGYHGSIDLYMAIKDSCNVFFAETARLLGIENMNAAEHLLVLNSAGRWVQNGMIALYRRPESDSLIISLHRFSLRHIVQQLLMEEYV